MLHSLVWCIATILWTYSVLSVSSYRVVNVESELCASFGADGCIVNQTIALNCTATSTNSSTVLPWSLPRDEAPNNICMIEFTSNVTFTNKSGLTCTNATSCQLWINVSSVVNGTTVGPSVFTVLPGGAYIAANTIRIAADLVSIGAGSSVTASGLGLAYGPAPGSQGSGGSYGGTGGGLPCQVSPQDEDARMMKTRLGVSTPTAMRVDTCCSKRFFNSYSNASVGSFSAPDVGWDTADPGSWGSGSGDFGQIRAGGRIWITATQSIGIDGTISADGDVGNGTQTFGSGSGGVIVLDAAGIGNNGGKVSANGGAGSIGHGAGGGGRIVLRYDTLSLPVSSVSAYGGTVQNSVSLDPTCFAGAAGTVFYSQRIPDQLDPAGLPLRYNTLRVSNDNLEALAVTPVYLDYNTLAGQFGPGSNATNTTNGTAPEPLVPLPPGVYAQDVTVGVDAFVVTGSSYVASLRLSTRKLFSTLNMPPPVLASPVVKDPHMALATWRAKEGNWSNEAVPYTGDLTPAELIALGDDAMPLWQRMRKQLQETRAVIVQQAAEACGQEDTGSDTRIVPPCLLSAISSGWSALPAQPVVGVSISLGFLLPLVDAANPLPPLGVNDTRANLTIITSELQVRASTILAAGTSVWVNAGNVTLVADAMLQVQDRVYLVTNSTAYIDCKLTELTGGFPAEYDGSDALIPGAVVVRAGKSVYYGPDTGLMTSQLYSYSDGNITVNGVIGTTNFELHEERVCRFDISRRELCRDIDWKLNQASPPNSSYLLVLSARGGVVEVTSNGRVNVEVGLLCGQQVNIDGPVSAEGQGCVEGLGFGSGKGSASGSGGGAGHASAGGAAADGAPGGPLYDDATTPLFVGSGGGGALGADGDGGGFIMAEGTFQVYVAPGTDLTAAASDGYSEGGGSGGTLIVRTFQLLGSGRLSVEGGGSYGEGGGGGGSGGILKLQSATLGPTVTASPSGPACVPYRALATPRASPVQALWARFEEIARRSTSALAFFVSAGAQRSASSGARAQRLMEACHALAADASRLHQDARAQYSAAVTAAHQAAEQSDRSEMEAALLWREETLSFLEAMAVLQTLLVHAQHASAACAQHAACARLHALTLSSTTLPAGSVDDGASESMDMHVYLRRLGVLTPVVLRDIASSFSGTLVLNGGPGAQGGQPGGNGTLNSPLCPAGTQRNDRAQCLPCGFGRWRNGSVDAPFVCALCTNAPATGTYTDETEDDDQCDYICPAGTLYPACLTSFEAVIDDFGGPLNFGLSVGGVIATVAAALLCVCQQRARAAAAFKQSEGVLVGKEDGLTFNMLLGWPSSSGTLERKGSKLGKGGMSGYGSASAGKSAAGRYGVFLGGTAAMGQADGKDRYDMAVAILQGGTGTLKTDSSGWVVHQAKLRALAYRASGTTTVDFLMSACAMQESDLPRHATRIYLGGSNTFASSWRLPWDATRRMRKHVRSGPYAELADKVNEILQWNRWGWEEWSYLFVRLLAPPLGEMFLRWRRRIRVVLLLQMLLASDRKDGWLRGAKAAMLADCVRVGVSGDLSQAHVDILASDRHSLAKTSAPLAASIAAGSAAPQPANSPTQGVTGGVTLPLTLLLSGDGSFGRPLHIDGNDLLVRCVPGLPGVLRFIDSDWTEFVAEFNARARLLTAGALLQTAGPLLDFLAAVRADPDLLGGLQVDLVRCWPTAQSAVEGQGGVSSQRRPAGGSEGGAKPGASGAIRPQESGDSFARERSEGTDGSSGLEPADSRDRTPEEGMEAEDGRLDEDSEPQDATAAATSVGYITLTRQSSMDSALPALLSGRRISDAEYPKPRSPHVATTAGGAAGAHSPHPKGLPGKPGSGSRLHAFIEEDGGSPQWIHRHGRQVSGDDMRMLGKGGPGTGLDLDDAGPTSPALLFEGRARGMSASRSLFVRSMDVAVPEAGGGPSSRRSSGSEGSADSRTRGAQEAEAVHIPVGPAPASREASIRVPARGVSAAPVVSKETAAWQTPLGTALEDDEEEEDEAELGFGYHGKRTQLWWSGLTSLVEDVVSSHECRLGILITLRSSNGTPSMGAGREGSAGGSAALALSSPALQGRTASAEVYPAASRAASALALSSQASGTGSRPGGFGPASGLSKPNRSPYQRAIVGAGSTSPGFTAAQRAQYRLEAEMEDVDNAGVTLSGMTGQGVYSSAFSGGSYPQGVGAGYGSGLGLGFGAHEHGMFQFGVGDEGVAMVQNAASSASAATGNGSSVAGRPALSSSARGMSMRRILVSEAKQQQQQMYQGALESSYGGYQATASAAAAPLSLGTSAPVGRRAVRGGTNLDGLVQGPLITLPFTAWAAVGNYDYWIGDADAVLWTASEPANAALTVLANALLLPQPYVGGDADVRGKRLPLVTSRLPVPGLPFAADIQLDGGLQLDFSRTGSLRTSHLFYMIGGSTWTPEAGVVKARRKPSNGSKRKGPTAAGADGSDEESVSFRSHRAGVDVRFSPSRSAGDLRSLQRSRSGTGRNKLISENPMLAESDFMQRVLLAEMSRRKVALKQLLEERGVSYGRRSNSKTKGRQSSASPARGTGKNGSQSSLGKQANGYSDEDDGGSSLDSSDEGEWARAKGRGGRKNRAGSSDSDSSEGRARGSNRYDDDEDDNLDDDEPQLALPYPAPPESFWSAGLAGLSVCSYNQDGQRAILTRLHFVLRRLLCRRAAPLAIRSAWKVNASFVLHGVCLLMESIMTTILIAQLACIESSGVEQNDDAAAPVDSLLVVGECSYFALTLYLGAPPLACLLAPLAGLFAIAAQSVTTLRAYAKWNAASLLSTSCALVMVALNVDSLGTTTLTIPLLLLALKMISASILLPIEVTALESYRPVRGWRGLYEIRAGPYERSHRAQAELLAGKRGGGGWAAVDGETWLGSLWREGRHAMD